MATTTDAPPRARRGPGDGDEPGRSSGGRLVLRRPAGHVGPISIVQVLVLEVVLIAALVLLRRQTWLVVAGVVLAVLVLVGTFGRYRGRWWSEQLLLQWRERRRRRSARTTTTDPRLAVIHDLVPDLTIHDVEGADDARIGVGGDSSGWFAVLAVAPAETVRGPVVPVPFEVLARAIGDAEQPGALAQVVTHTVPAPRASPDAPPCDISYAELLAPIGGRAPVDECSWVVVRLDARALAESILDAGRAVPRDSAADAHALLALLVRRVRRALRRGGCPTRILDSDELLDALTRSLELDPAETEPISGARESWRTWQSAGLRHACYWLRRWPDADSAAETMTRLAATPAAFVSVAISFVPVSSGATEQETELRCLIRVAARPDELEASCRHLEQTAHELGVALLRLDGEQAPAVYASAPTGGAG